MTRSSVAVLAASALAGLIYSSDLSAQTQPQPIVVFKEDFENNMSNTADGARGYTAGGGYTGANGHTYTGSPGWTDGMHCNGIIMSFNNSDEPAWAHDLNTRCTEPNRSYLNLLSLAKGIGLLPGNLGDNGHMVTAYSECRQVGCVLADKQALSELATGSVMFQTVRPVAIDRPGFFTFSVDAGAVNCDGAPDATPKYQFQLQHSNGPLESIGSPIEPCTNSDGTPAATPTFLVPNYGSLVSPLPNRGVWAVRRTSEEAFKYEYSSLHIRMYNLESVSHGNDGGFDNVTLLNVTPHLSKSFPSTSVAAGGTTTIEFTVINTTDNLAKEGWSFIDELPAGMVWDNSTAAGTCTDATNTAGTVATVSIAPAAAPSNGRQRMKIDSSLPAGSSCTVMVGVTVDNATTSPTLENCGSNIITPLFITPPANSTCATIAVTRPITLGKIWGTGATTGDQLDLDIAGATGAIFLNVAGQSTAPATLTAATAQIQLGRPLTVSETFTSGDPAAYAKNLACVKVSDGSSITTSPAGAAFTLTMPTDSEVSCVFTNNRQTAELTITKDNGASQLVSGSTTQYRISIGNSGPSDAHGAVLSDPVFAGLQCSAVSCGEETGHAVCPTSTIASLQGTGIVLATFPANSSLVFTVTCVVD